jgi:molybdopterin synthase catalytic subunit
MSPVAVTSDPLDLQALIEEISRASTADGAITSFVGLVREQNQGRRVSFLEYEAYEPLAIRALQLIIDEARDTWSDTRIGVHHRTGRLELGEASIIIVGDVSASRPRVCGMPLHDRAGEADRPDLEARTLRGWRRVARRRHRGSCGRGGARNRAPDRMRVTVRLFARLRDLAGSGELVRDVATPATVETVWRSLVAEMPDLHVYERTMSVAGQR